MPMATRRWSPNTLVNRSLISWRDPVVRAALRTARLAAGTLLLIVFLAIMASLISFSASDPSWNTAAAGPTANWLGTVGAYVSDVLLQWLGIAAVALALPLGVWGLRLVRNNALEGQAIFPKNNARLGWLVLAVVLLATGFGLLPQSMPFVSPVLSGWGGSLGGMMRDLFAGMFARAEWMQWLWTPALVILPAGFIALLWALAFERQSFDGIAQMFGAMGRAMRRRFQRHASDSDDFDDEDVPEPLKGSNGPRPKVRREPGMAEPNPRVVTKTDATKRGQRESKERQGALALGDDYVLPSLDLLTIPPKERAKNLDSAALEKNARFLETVLQDFGVDGRIVEVRPGPVVTLYELEPAPGIKASRIIGLADDIARSMSAISARVAVIPGRNVIGIELPNKNRDTVYLRDLMASDAFEAVKGPLPLVLGKNISGEPVIADLAPMPHLLIAGATGAGKSVGLNAMILSLLYRLTPRQCRFIMIDPKMLELSIYDGIPHLLAPVVTEPKKAIVALKWAVREMDERYGRMSKLAVRNIAQFNERVREAKNRGQSLSRKVHTGYDDGGKPIYEEQLFDFEELPLLVVIVDELADLMMVAGKEIEFLIQRLAQKARAAGIHLILATQRPSVDVITGVIKANLPTRVSFAVTSKIDSRTILNEQGAEQLLGRGDMLYMQGGRLLQRVHGPLVSESEVEKVADHWRGQGMPDYLDQVTEDPEEESARSDDEAGDKADDLLSRAVEVVASEQKASTSFIQRHLRIGYNNAARLMDQMEKLGYISSPDHVGRREVLIDEDGGRR